MSRGARKIGPVMAGRTRENGAEAQRPSAPPSASLPAHPAGTVSWNVVPAVRNALTFALTCAGVRTWSFTCRT